MKLLMAFFSILLFTACERAQNKGYDGPNFVEQAITKKKLEIFRLQMEAMQPSPEQKMALAHRELKSKIDVATLNKDDAMNPIYILGTEGDHDYSMMEYTPIEGARRRLFIFSKPKQGRDYNMVSSNPDFTDRKEGDAIIAACMLVQRNELKKLTTKYPKLMVLLDTKEILITNFPTKKVREKDWEAPVTAMESSEVTDYHKDNVSFSNVLMITVPTLWIDGYGYTQKQTEKEFCHGLVTAEEAGFNLVDQLKNIKSEVNVELSFEQLKELAK